MCNDELENIAEQIGSITEEQNDEDEAREGDEFNHEDYYRDRDDEYDGNR